MTLSNLLSLSCSFVFHSPLWQRLPQCHWLCPWKTVSFSVCLNLFLPTITGCPLVLLFWGFLCWTSLCCLGIYRLLFYLPLTYLFSELENIRLRILSCVSCSFFLIGQGNKETDVKKQLITAGEFRGNWAWVLAFLFQNTVVNPGDEVSPPHTVTPLTHKVSVCFPCVGHSSPLRRNGCWRMLFLVLMFWCFKQRNSVKELQRSAWQIGK